MQLEYTYWWFSEILPKLFCKDIIEFAKSKNKEKLGLVAGFSENNKFTKDQVKEIKKVRNSNIIWLDEPWIFNKITPLVKEANEKANWNYEFDCCEKAQFTIYKKNQFYDWHSDSYLRPNENNKNRKLSVTVLLNDPSEFEGGDLEFDIYTKPNEKKHVVSTKKHLTGAGSLIVFPSFIYHKVTPVTKGVRYSLVIWFQGSQLR
jgi:PKHD-type hydroxylase